MWPDQVHDGSYRPAELLHKWNIICIIISWNIQFHIEQRLLFYRLVSGISVVVSFVNMIALNSGVILHPGNESTSTPSTCNETWPLGPQHSLYVVNYVCDASHFNPDSEGCWLNIGRCLANAYIVSTWGVLSGLFTSPGSHRHLQRSSGTVFRHLCHLRRKTSYRLCSEVPWNYCVQNINTEISSRCRLCWCRGLGLNFIFAGAGKELSLSFYLFIRRRLCTHLAETEQRSELGGVNFMVSESENRL